MLIIVALSDSTLKSRPSAFLHTLNVFDGEQRFAPADDIANRRGGPRGRPLGTIISVGAHKGRPYGLCTVRQDDDAVHVVRHDDESIQLDLGKTRRHRAP